MAQLSSIMEGIESERPNCRNKIDEFLPSANKYAKVGKPTGPRDISYSTYGNTVNITETNKLLLEFESINVFIGDIHAEVNNAFSNQLGTGRKKDMCM